MIDPILIEQRLVLLSGYLSELEKLAEIPSIDFLPDKIKSGAAESYLRRSLEAIFDVGRHLLAKSGFKDLAAEYKAIARGLHQIKAIDEALSQKLLEMAGYRNRLVHLYNEVTDEELYEILQNDLDDLKNFIKQIQNYLRALKQDER